MLDKEMITGNIELADSHADREENLADVLADILRRLEVLESHFTFQGLDDLTQQVEHRLVTRLRNTYRG